jgi:hypothetical protein
MFHDDSFLITDRALALPLEGKTALEMQGENDLVLQGSSPQSQVAVPIGKEECSFWYVEKDDSLHQVFREAHSNSSGPVAYLKGARLEQSNRQLEARKAFQLH